MATEVTVINEALSAEHSFTYDEITKIFEGIQEVWQYINKITPEDKITIPNLYVGITGDPTVRLKAHNIATDACYLKKQDNEFIARQIERYYTRFKKTNGDTGGKIKEGFPPLWVYCFLKNDKTDPKL